MKPREAYRITAVRVVEFHNLGTTTIEIPEGGHLFLLGDNGSGKTTILDAIHLVLTGGREMEFNAAARVAGAKDSGGRTIQGVVLRYNAVTGRTAREAGITYAAVELRSDAGRVCSLAVGLSASGLDVAFERWGGIASSPVADLPLTIGESGRLRAATRSEFERGMKSLPGGRYYPHINEYADAVGARLFGGDPFARREHAGRSRLCGGPRGSSREDAFGASALRTPGTGHRLRRAPSCVAGASGRRRFSRDVAGEGRRSRPRAAHRLA